MAAVHCGLHRTDPSLLVSPSPHMSSSLSSTAASLPPSTPLLHCSVISSSTFHFHCPLFHVPLPPLISLQEPLTSPASSTRPQQGQH